MLRVIIKASLKLKPGYSSIAANPTNCNFKTPMKLYKYTIYKEDTSIKRRNIILYKQWNFSHSKYHGNDCIMTLESSSQQINRKKLLQGINVKVTIGRNLELPDWIRLKLIRHTNILHFNLQWSKAGALSIIKAKPQMSSLHFPCNYNYILEDVH